jgi:hypothetical protein
MNDWFYTTPHRTTRAVKYYGNNAGSRRPRPVLHPIRRPVQVSNLAGQSATAGAPVF